MAGGGRGRGRKVKNELYPAGENSTTFLLHRPHPKGRYLGGHGAFFLRAGEYRGVGLVGVIWKLTTSIISKRLAGVINMHDDIQGFREGRGVGAAIVEANLAQKLEAIKRTPLFHIFLDPQKSYGAIDRGMRPEILKGYGIGPRIPGILGGYWEYQ